MFIMAFRCLSYRLLSHKWKSLTGSKVDLIVCRQNCCLASLCKVRGSVVVSEYLSCYNGVQS
jgi:hypothetical protein